MSDDYANTSHRKSKKEKKLKRKFRVYKRGGRERDQHEHKD